MPNLVGTLVRRNGFETVSRAFYDVTGGMDELLLQIMEDVPPDDVV